MCIKFSWNGRLTDQEHTAVSVSTQANRFLSMIQHYPCSFIQVDAGFLKKRQRKYPTSQYAEARALLQLAVAIHYLKEAAHLLSLCSSYKNRLHTAEWGLLLQLCHNIM